MRMKRSSCLRVAPPAARAMRTRWLVARTSAVALAAAALPAVAGGTVASASTFEPDIGAVTFATRYAPAAFPTSTAQAIAIYNAAATNRVGYCTRMLAALPGVSNHAVCAGQMRNIGFHVTVPFSTADAGVWSFRVAPDMGHGGTLLVDGAEVVAHWYDMWWGGSWSDPALLLQASVTLAAGSHTLELYGFEDCCDGSWGAQLQPPGGAWQDIDTSPPSVTVTGVSATSYEFGSVPAAGCAVADAFDGNRSFAATLSAISGPRAAAGLGTQTASCAYTDSHLLSNSDSMTYTIVDTTPPVITLGVTSISVEATTGSGATVTYAQPTGLDAVDGAVPVSCTPPSGSTFPLGTSTVTCTATDIAGNTATATFTVTVTCPWSGFRPPLTDGGHYKLGRTLPVKFTLTGDCAHLTTVVARLYVAPVAGGVTGPEQPATSTSAADTGNTFRSAGSGQYLYDLATTPLSAGTWRLRVDFGDGLVRAITVTLD